ncbi:MAG: DNA recombination protein RmuC [candidate division Zixibacteria bacterium]|nr:DNA recombination protein RmuC [candidate division Zixibacteria bacterium]
MTAVLYFAAGLIVGIAITIIIHSRQKSDVKALARELASEANSEKIQDLEQFLGRVKESFDSVSMEALDKSLKQHLAIAKGALSEQSAVGKKDIEGKKELIFETFNTMKAELEKVSGLMKDFEGDRQKKYGELSNLLSSTGNQLNRLHDTTSKLTTALVRSRVRGNWGERMAEDILKLAGFIHGINYYKQKTLQESAQRPDFTFVLPNDQKVNMDVKFPFNNYWLFLESENPDEKDKYKKQFLKDVKSRIKELTSRDYINPDDNTVDIVIMFIPNEQVYAFINENDNTILDDAIKNKVALCSPLTLFAILAVIRQAIDNFNIERTANQILSLMGGFYKQWGLYVDSQDKMGKRIDDAQKEFNKLVTTRRTQFEKILEKIEQLRQQKDLPSVEVDSVTFQPESPPDDRLESQ